MFDRYFCARVATRLRASPDADWLGSFLGYLDRRGYARLTIQVSLREAELFGLWLRQQGRALTTISDADPRAFATHSSRTLSCTARFTVRRLLRHLRERRLVPPGPAPAPARVERVVMAYDAHLRTAAGLAPATCLYHRRFIREFLRATFGTGPLRWSELRPEHVRAFIAGFGHTGRTASAQLSAGTAQFPPLAPVSRLRSGRSDSGRATIPALAAAGFASRSAGRSTQRPPGLVRPINSGRPPRFRNGPLSGRSRVACQRGGRPRTERRGCGGQHFTSERR
jgi:hypothetical protein